MNNSQIADSLNRLYLAAKEFKNINNDTELCAELGIDTLQTVQNWKKRGVPKNWILKISEKWGLNANWLSTGKGEMRNEVEYKYIQFESASHKVEEPKAKLEVSRKPNTDLIDQLSPKSKQIVLDLINQLIELEKANTWF